MKPRYNRLARKNIIGHNGLAPQYVTTPYMWLAEEDFEEMRPFFHYPKMTFQSYKAGRGPTSGVVKGGGFVVPIRVKPDLFRKWCAFYGVEPDPEGLQSYLNASIRPDFPRQFRAEFPRF